MHDQTYHANKITKKMKECGSKSIPLDLENQDSISEASCWDLRRESWPPHLFSTAIWRAFHLDNMFQMPCLNANTTAGFCLWEGGVDTAATPFLPTASIFLFQQRRKERKMKKWSLKVAPKGGEQRRNYENDTLIFAISSVTTIIVKCFLFIFHLLFCNLKE